MNRNGFTLIELLVTIVVLALIMGIVFPSAIRLSKDNKTEEGTTNWRCLLLYIYNNVYYLKRSSERTSISSLSMARNAK